MRILPSVSIPTIVFRPISGCEKSWVITGDSAQTGNQTATYSAEDEGSVIWSNVLGGQRGVYDTILVADGYVIVKYGTGMESSEYVASLVCYDAETGDEKWSFTYPALLYYETATPVVVSDMLFADHDRLLFRYHG